MKKYWKIRLLAIFLIVIFGLGTLALLAFMNVTVIPKEGKAVFGVHLIISLVTNIGFVVGAVGLLRIRSWGLWLTVGLCGVSVLHLLWQLFTTLTPEAATKSAEIGSYVVAGFYLAIVFFLTKDSTRKCFRKEEGTPQP